MLVTILLIAYYFVPYKVTQMITDFDPYTFDDILDYDSMRLDYGIGSNNLPDDYGFTNYQEVNVKALHEDLNLNAWYVPANTDTTVQKCIVLVHGRTSNRLKTMKYLELIKDQGLDTLYNICIPDLRNSGKSDPSKTYMGYKFGEDLAAYLLFLKKEKNQNAFILYGFSQGVTAILNALGRNELADTIQNEGIQVEKLIFDSSLSNVSETLWQNGEQMGFPRFYFDIILENFSSEINGFAPNLRLSALWNEHYPPTLILHSKADKTTSYDLLMNELALIDQSNVQLETFERVNHVKIYQDSIYHDPYTKIVGEFIRK